MDCFIVSIKLREQEKAGSLGGDDDDVVVQMWACQWRSGTIVVQLQEEEVWTFASMKDHQDHCWKQESV